ncbi:YggT family protein [bacterium]|nr:YggT family protein [candidate division CSSED10-310 bacterium]
MGTILTTISILVNLLILALIMKLTLNPREFFFNPFLRPVEYITDPILKPLHRFFRPTAVGWDYTPLLAIISLVILQTFAIFIFSNNSILMSMVVCAQSVFSLLLQFVTICVIVTLMVPAYGSNPLIKFMIKVLTPFIRIFGFLSKTENGKIVAAFLGILMIAFLIWHFLVITYHQLIPLDVLRPDLLTSLRIGKHVNISDSAFSLSVLVYSLSDVLLTVIAVYQFLVFLLIANCVLSWIDLDARNPVVQFVFALTEPILAPVRRLFPTLSGIDISPLIVIAIISIAGFGSGRTIKYIVSLVFGA